MSTNMQGRDIAIAVIAVLVILVLLGGGMMGFGMMTPWMLGMMGGYVSPWWSILMLIFWVVVIVGGIWLAVWAMRSGGPALTQSNSAKGAEETSLEILKKRYAKGEINKEQFDQMKQDLGD